MATTTILQLPQAISLTGAELLEAAEPVTLPGAVQGWASIRVTASQIAALASLSAAPQFTRVAAAVPSAGANNNFTAGGQMGPTIGFIELSPTAPCNISGLQAGFDGQIVVITDLTAFNTTLNALNVGSLAPNRFRMASDAILTQNNGRSFKYSASIGLWVAL